MANTTNVPVTVQGTFDYWGAELYIGDKGYVPQPADAKNAYWFVVVDLESLDVVANEISKADDSVPASVNQYADNPKYLLIVATSGLRSDRVPQGALYTFLKSAGSGPKLEAAEQISEQLGTGTIGNFCYILAATLDPEDLPGFEEFSYTNMRVMTFALMPVTVDGTTTYTPVQLSV